MNKTHINDTLNYIKYDYISIWYHTVYLILRLIGYKDVESLCLLNSGPSSN